MKIHEAAELALRELRNPTHLRDLVPYIEGKGYFHFGAVNPETALGVQLSRYGLGTAVGRRPTGEEKFFRAAPGTYGLLEWLNSEQRYSLDLDEISSEFAVPDELDAKLFMEHELQDWLYKNLNANGLSALGFGQLRLFDPEKQASRSGRYATGVVGEIDMLLITPTNDFLVIELKRRAIDTTVGQICRYFGYVRRHLCGESRSVHGLILTQEISDTMRYALDAVNEAIHAREITFQIGLGRPVTGHQE